ncbi:MAG: TetR/AcrR family transcriptional regulator [Actinomycetota bacterium]
MPTPADARTEARARTSWAGVPVADRRAERRTLLLDAAFDLLGTEGWSGTTVRAVCQRARLNPRYFYESFDDLDALAVAVYDRVVEELQAEVAAAHAAAGPNPKARARAGIERIIGFVDEDRRRARILYVEALGNEALNRRRIETGYSVVTLVEQGEQIGRIAAAVFVGGLSELLMAWVDGRIEVSREQLTDDVTELFAGLGAAARRIAADR